MDIPCLNLVPFHKWIFDVHSLSCNNVCPERWASAWMNVWRATQIPSLLIWMWCKSRFPSRSQTCGQTNNDFFIALASFWMGKKPPPQHATYWTFSFSHLCGRSEAGRRCTLQRKMATMPWSSGCWRPALRWRPRPLMVVASGRGFWRVVWRWLLDRAWLLKVGDRLNEFQVLEKPERNMKKAQSFKEIWKKKHFWRTWSRALNLLPRVSIHRKWEK